MSGNLPKKMSISEIRKEVGSFYKLIGWSSNGIDGLSVEEAFQREQLHSKFNRGLIIINSSFPIVLNYFYELFSGKFKKERFATIIIEEKLFKTHFNFFGDDEKRSLFEDPNSAMEDMKEKLFLTLEDFIAKNQKIGILRSKETKQKHNFLIDIINKKEDVKLTDFLNIQVKELHNELIKVPRCWLEIFTPKKTSLYTIDLKGDINEIYSDVYSVFIDEKTKSLRIRFESSENNIIGSFNDYAFDEETRLFSFDNPLEAKAKKYLTLQEAKDELIRFINRKQIELDSFKEKVI